MTDIFKPTADDGLSAAEIILYDDIMAERAKVGLAAIPLSKSLTIVEGRHAADQIDNAKTLLGHGWANPTMNGSRGAWAETLGLSYTAACFEIEAEGAIGYTITPGMAISGWLGSPTHRSIMLSTTNDWRAIGVGMKDGVAFAYFGTVPDSTGLPTIDNFDPLRYLCGYSDLITSFGVDTSAAANHYLWAGAKEGRNPNTFDALGYIASNGDLIQAYGADTVAAEKQYIATGHKENRQLHAFNANNYLAANADVRAAFGTDTMAATIHYIQHGYSEHRALAPIVS